MAKNETRFALMGARTGNCIRVAVALEVLGIPYETVAIDLREGEHRQPEFLATNPFGRVPVLLDRAAGPESSALTQSNAILLHLCETKPGALIPIEGDPARAMVLERFFYFVTDVIAVGASSFTLSRDRDPEGAELLMRRALDAIADAQRFLAPGPFMAGSQFTLADIAAVTVINAYADRVAWNDLPHLQSWFAAVTSRDDVRRGLATFSAS
jgi:GST-like protein